MSNIINMQDIHNQFDEASDVEKTARRDKHSIKYGKKEQVRNQRRLSAKRKGRITS
jgi:hypothetical protein